MKQPSFTSLRRVRQPLFSISPIWDDLRADPRFTELVRRFEAAKMDCEKTAVIASIFSPEYAWLAAGAKQNLNAEKLFKLGAEKIILYPDADGYKKWREMARNARLIGRAVEVSDLLETCAIDEQKAEGCDLADYLIDEQTGINRENEIIDAHNRRL